MKKLLKEYESYFAQNGGKGCPTAKVVYTHTKGKGVVCFCAPHAVHSFVHKQEKNRDVGTGAIVQYLGKQAGFAAIVRNKFVPRKEMISDFILAQKLEDSFFLDIHGMKVHKNFDLAIGTGYLGRQKYADVLKKAGELCRKYKIKYRVNLPKYSGKIGLTGRLQKATGRPQVLQLEFSPSFRDVEGAVIREKTIPFLIELGEFINNKGGKHVQNATKNHK
ncbi:MAG: hypothetical protein II942_04550 [Alphaproteobacteria bacterium]|nr:hypothetical protein [Alphaproteobacteria bacterium]